MTLQDDLSRLRHIRDASDEALQFIAYQTKDDLKNNRMLALSLVKELEIIGEAANNISQECQSRYPGIPWGDIIGMRNRLVHAYFGIDYDIVWQTVTENLPSLLSQIQIIIAQELNRIDDNNIDV
jgi:uncharacterized protein with HEPN domain